MTHAHNDGTNCIACHNDSDAEGGVNLESVEKMQASDVEDILIPGKPDASRLFLLASHAEDPVMPPDDNGRSWPRWPKAVPKWNSSR